MDLSDEPLASFVTAVVTTLSEMAGLEAAVREAAPTTAVASPAEVTVGIRLRADVDGWLILSLPPATARALAGRILAESGREPDRDMIQDCVGELANVAAGQAKTLLLGTPYHFTLSTPTVLTAIPDDVRPGGAWTIIFATDVGDLAVHVLPARANAAANRSTPD